MKGTTMMDWNGDGGWAYSGGSYMLMILAMVIFWGLVIAAVVYVLRQPSRQDRTSGGIEPAHGGAQQVLAERFARGEIDETEFTSRRATLHAQPHP